MLKKNVKSTDVIATATLSTTQNAYYLYKKGLF